uniref:(northern house mosquito) hypothetical protein n=1 Tax=Culex pipiens TaxID=7175 RepID=A0A8D8N4E8_CULPI
MAYDSFSTSSAGSSPEAPQRLRHQPERRRGTAEGCRRKERRLQGHPARRCHQVQRRWPHQPLDLLEEPLTGPVGSVGRAEEGPRAGLARFRELQEGDEGRRRGRPGLGLGLVGLQQEDEISAGCGLPEPRPSGGYHGSGPAVWN